MRSYARFNRGLVSQYQKWMVAMHYARVTKTIYLKALLLYVDFIGKRFLPAQITATFDYFSRRRLKTAQLWLPFIAILEYFDSFTTS